MARNTRPNTTLLSSTDAARSNTTGPRSQEVNTCQLATQTDTETHGPRPSSRVPDIPDPTRRDRAAFSRSGWGPVSPSGHSRSRRRIGRAGTSTGWLGEAPESGEARGGGNSGWLQKGLGRGRKEGRNEGRNEGRKSKRSCCTWPRGLFDTILVSTPPKSGESVKSSLRRMYLFRGIWNLSAAERGLLTWHAFDWNTLWAKSALLHVCLPKRAKTVRVHIPSSPESTVTRPNPWVWILNILMMFESWT